MNDRPRILYVGRGEIGETIRSAVDRTDFVPVEATDGTDALKRLEYEFVDAVVLPHALPDVPVDVFLGRARVAGAATPCIVVGEVDRVTGPMIQVAGDVTVAALSDRIRRAIRDRRLGSELDRHEGLKNAFLRIAGAVDDQTELERVLHDALYDLGEYRFVWVGRYDPEDGDVLLRQPFRRRVDVDEFGTLVGRADGSFVRSAIDRREVTNTRTSVATRSGARLATADSAGDADDLVLTTVPLADRERTYGVVVLATDPIDAPDGSERSLLYRIGRVCGLVIGRETGTDGESARLSGLMQIVAHELRNPLQIAMLSVETARDDGSDASFERAIAALESMRDVVDTGVRMATDGRVESVEPVDVHEVAVSVWRTVHASAAELTIAEPATVEADPALLERLLSNLLRNAIDHGGDDVSVSIGALPGDRGFYVEDDGPGIPPAQRESVFEFETTTAEGGLGIGLAFVREIARTHGWEVAVTEGCDGGARFEVRVDERTTGARDELAALFSGDAGGFEFPDEPRAE